MNDQRAMAELAREIVAQELTVRDVENRVRGFGSSAPGRKKSSKSNRSAEASRIEEDLRRRLQTDVAITVDKSGGGTVKVSFYSPDDLERVLDVIIGGGRERR